MLVRATLGIHSSNGRMGSAPMCREPPPSTRARTYCSYSRVSFLRDALTGKSVHVVAQLMPSERTEDQDQDPHHRCQPYSEAVPTGDRKMGGVRAQLKTNLRGSNIASHLTSFVLEK